MAFLVDTCVLSELLKAAPDPRVVAWASGVDERDLYLSVLTLGELRKGVAKLSDRRRRERLERWIDGDLRERFQGRIIPVCERVAARWGELSGTAEARGVRVPVVDGLLGATALVHDLTVATRNVADIEKTGARVWNPWA